MTHPDIPQWITFLFAAMLVLMILALILEERLHAKKSLITGVTAIIVLIFGNLLIPAQSAHSGHMPFYIPLINWEVVLIIMGASLFVDVVSKSGIFSWVALKLTKMSKGDPFILLIYYSLLTVIFSAFLNNVTAMIIVGSLSAVSLNKLGLKNKLLGFLMVEGLLTNIGGLLTLISSVPNIIVGQTAKIGFVKFFMISSPYVVVATIATIFMGKIVFKISSLKGEKEKEEAYELVNSFDENEGIPDKQFFKFSFFMFAVLILLFSTQSILPVLKDLGLGFVAMAMAFIMLIKYKHSVDKNYQALDWDLLFFFSFLFIVIGIMEEAGVLTLLGSAIAGLLSLPGAGGSMALLWGSAFLSAVTDNIPLAAVLANVLQGLNTATDSNFWWCVIFGSNLGGNITPIGSASTVVAVTLIHKNNIKLSFVGFFKLAIGFAVMQLILASVYILLIF